jgi:hypothetical protein
MAQQQYYTLLKHNTITSVQAARGRFLRRAEDIRGVNKRVIVFSAKDRIFVRGERHTYIYTTLPTLCTSIKILTDI